MLCKKPREHTADAFHPSLCLSFWKMPKRWSFSLNLNSPGMADQLASEVGLACLGLKLQVCATVAVLVFFFFFNMVS